VTDGQLYAAGVCTTVVVIPTVGRPQTVRRVVNELTRQSRRPDRVLVVGASAVDISGLENPPAWVEVHLAPRGSCAQRNYALDLIGKQADFTAFFDDDFVPAEDYLARAEGLLMSHPDVVGVCGRPIADGASGPGITFQEAVDLLADAPERAPSSLIPLIGLYGCNMVFKTASTMGARFDENLPLYGWQEDFDFSRQVSSHGRLVASLDLRGVHMGEKSGRGPGKRFGYSQIANPIYLLRKGSMPGRRALRLMRDNVLSNFVRTPWPEPYVDRRGRLLGNTLALRDLVLGRLDPRRILDLD